MLCIYWMKRDSLSKEINMNEEKHEKPMERPWLMVCPNCKFRCGKQRAGAEFQNEARCHNCEHIWSIGFRLIPGY